eukprot:evm.model.NODE_3239_length_31224_cov_31.538591.3
MIERTIGWLKDKMGDGGPVKGKKRRYAYIDDQKKDIADNHPMCACPSVCLKQPRHKSLSSLLPSVPDAEAYEDVDLSSDTGNEESDRQDTRSESSPPLPSYHSLAATTGPMPEACSFMLKQGPSELPQSKRARHTHMLYLGGPIVNQAQKTNTSNNNSSGRYAALPDVYLDFFDVFDLPEPRETTQFGQESFNGDSRTVVDAAGAEANEKELRQLADDKAAIDDDDDDDSKSTRSSPLFPPVAAKSREGQYAQSNPVGYLLGDPVPVYGVASIPRQFNSAPSSPFNVIYTFTSDMALHALVAPEALGPGGCGKWKKQTEAANVKKDEDEDEDDILALFGRRPTRQDLVDTQSEQPPSVIWEREEALVDCKVKLSEEGCSVGAGADLPLHFGIETDTFWPMEEVVCVNLYRSVDQLGGRSLLLLAKHASQRPPWAPERLEIVVVPLDTKANEQNAAAMLSLLAPAHARGPAKGGALEAHLQVFEGRGELDHRCELTYLLARLVWHDSALTKVGCARNGGQYKRKQE